MRAISFLVSLTIFAFALLPAALLASTRSKQEKKHAVEHPAAQHATPHPKALLDAPAKKRGAEAKKSLAKDRKQEKNDKEHQTRAEHTAKVRKAHPVSQPIAQRSRSNRAAKHGAGAKVNTATASRVHAWVNAQRSTRQTSTDPHPDPHIAATDNPVKAVDKQAAAPYAANGSDTGTADTGTADTGTAIPPPDTAQGETDKQLPAINVIQTPAGLLRLPATEDLAAEPVILPTLYTRRGRLVVPPPLKGSHEILLRQNQVADDEGLDRIRNDDDLDRMRAAGLLVPLPANSVLLHTDDRLPANRRYCRPWTVLFLETLARQHYARFQSALQLTSAVRTVEFQQQLIHRNGNAAPAEGDTASPHLTGQAIDLGKKGLSTAEIAWLRGYLLPLVQQGKVDVEEEFQQSCFHISVYKKYFPQAGAGRRSIASTRGTAIGVLATGLR